MISGKGGSGNTLWRRGWKASLDESGRVGVVADRIARVLRALPDEPIETTGVTRTVSDMTGVTGSDMTGIDSRDSERHDWGDRDGGRGGRGERVMRDASGWTLEPALAGRGLGIAFDWRVIISADRADGIHRGRAGALGRAEMHERARRRLAEALAELPAGTAARGQIVRVFVHGDVPDRLVETADRAPDGTITWTTQPVR